MSSHIGNPTEKSPLFQLKGGLYTLTAIQLLSTNLALVEEQLDLKIQQAPKFFQNAPIVIDLQKISRLNLNIDFKQLKEILQKKQLIPVGVKGGNTEQYSAAINAGFAILQDSIKEREEPELITDSIDKQNTSQTSNVSNASGSNISGSNASKSSNISNVSNLATESTSFDTPDSSQTGHSEQTNGYIPATTKLITEPVRSGQQIYARGADLIVLAPVSHGSELLADGHIHIYGPLRGRALAGVTGNTKARIFCQSLEAELISVAGQYKISEDIEPSIWRQAVDIYLEEGRLHIRQL